MIADGHGVQKRREGGRRDGRPQAAEHRIDEHHHEADDRGKPRIDAEHVGDNERGALDVDDDLNQRAEQRAKHHHAARQIVAVETSPHEFGDRVTLGHEIANLANEGDGRDHRETVRNREPEESGEAERIGLRRGHHDRHRPGPDRDQPGHAEAKADFPVGDNEVLGVPDQFYLDVIDESQERDAEKDLACDPARGAERLVSCEMKFAHGLAPYI